MGTGGHNVPIIMENSGKIRKLTPRECFNLQGFPANYKIGRLSDSKLYGLSGNAITVSVGSKIGKQVLSLFWVIKEIPIVIDTVAVFFDG